MRKVCHRAFALKSWGGDRQGSPSESSIPRMVVLTRAASSSMINSNPSPLISLTFPSGSGLLSLKCILSDLVENDLQ